MEKIAYVLNFVYNWPRCSYYLNITWTTTYESRVKQFCKELIWLPVKLKVWGWETEYFLEMLQCLRRREPQSSFTIHKHCFGKRKARILSRQSERDCSVQMLDLTVFRKQVQNLFLRGFICLKIRKVKETTFKVPISEFPQNVLL